ncbi:flagellar hook-basal body complex protein [Ferrimonas marina]|uniref:Flagellar basal-body rod protein FlgF n=1 Tax=Ferrimonas marina TaxID=299255 RepID=A0A1M5TGI7_9GAMM|nr:flagellar hook-basal body complex protein [Ferrimonas marina]SHH49473.1 flagellar basal-body rod protein FlgF [Ferrimonas marina]
MDNSLYVGMSAAKQHFQQEAVLSHNVANANTPGFKADQADFHALYLNGPGLNDTAFTQLESLSVDKSRGTLRTTNRELDVTTANGAYMEVQTPSGSRGYVTTASIQLDNQGMLRTSEGHFLLDERGPASVPTGSKVTISPEGQIIARSPSGAVFREGYLQLVELDHLKLGKSPEGLLISIDDTQSPRIYQGDGIRTGVLESSNVDSMLSLAELVHIQRSYEQSIKLMKASDSMHRQSIGILRGQ